MRRVVAVALLSLSLPDGLGAQGQDLRSDRYGEFAVRLSVRSASGRPSEGYGIKVRQSNDTIFVVTANHVVSPPEWRDSSLIGVYLFRNSVRYEGRVIARDPEADLALVAVLHAKADWDYRASLAKAKRAAPVWILGRGGEWLATLPGMSGRISSITDSEIKADFAGVEPGASGGPLITNDGIVGMIVDDAQGNRVTALRMDIVRELVLGKWLGVPLDSASEFPFVALSIGFGLSFPLPDMDALESAMPPTSLGVGVDVAFSSHVAFGLQASHMRYTSNHTVFPTLQRLFKNDIVALGGSIRFYAARPIGNAEPYTYVSVERLAMRPRVNLNAAGWQPLEDVLPAGTPNVRGAWAFTLGGAVNARPVGPLILNVESFAGMTTTPHLSLNTKRPFDDQNKSKEWFLGVRVTLGLITRRNPALGTNLH